MTFFWRILSIYDAFSVGYNPQALFLLEISAFLRLFEMLSLILRTFGAPDGVFYTTSSLLSQLLYVLISFIKKILSLKSTIFSFLFIICPEFRYNAFEFCLWKKTLCFLTILHIHISVLLRIGKHI